MSELQQDIKLHSIEDAINAIRNGKVIIVVDDEGSSLWKLSK